MRVTQVARNTTLAKIITLCGGAQGKGPISGRETRLQVFYPLLCHCLLAGAIGC